MSSKASANIYCFLSHLNTHCSHSEARKFTITQESAVPHNIKADPARTPKGRHWSLRAQD